jgi:hypothetical protein
MADTKTYLQEDRKETDRRTGWQDSKTQTDRQVGKEADIQTDI